jgi:gamma-glutamyltranspeptidase/glutathione hydrolase
LVDFLLFSIGGDCFCIYFDAKSGSVHGLNGSGRAPKLLSLNKLSNEILKLKHLPLSNINCITVPGAVAGWCDALNKWGKLDMKTVLQPAIELAEKGSIENKYESESIHMYKYYLCYLYYLCIFLL